MLQRPRRWHRELAACTRGGWKQPRHSELGVNCAGLLAKAAWTSPAHPSMSCKCCRNLESLHSSGKLFAGELCLCQGLTSTFNPGHRAPGSFLHLRLQNCSCPPKILKIPGTEVGISAGLTQNRPRLAENFFFNVKRGKGKGI